MVQVSRPTVLRCSACWNHRKAVQSQSPGLPQATSIKPSRGAGPAQRVEFPRPLQCAGRWDQRTRSDVVSEGTVVGDSTGGLWAGVIVLECFQKGKIHFKGFKQGNDRIGFLPRDHARCWDEKGLSGKSRGSRRSWNPLRAPGRESGRGDGSRGAERRPPETSRWSSQGSVTDSEGPEQRAHHG